MRRMLFVLVLAISLFGLFPAAVMASSGGDMVITPFYSYAQSAKADLNVSSGTATCTGSASASSASNTVSITVTLQKKVGSTWTNVQSWTNSSKEDASVKATKSLTKGYQYQVVLSGYIKDANGKNLESISATSTVYAY